MHRIGAARPTTEPTHIALPRSPVRERPWYDLLARAILRLIHPERVIRIAAWLRRLPLPVEAYRVGAGIDIGSAPFRMLAQYIGAGDIAIGKPVRLVRVYPDAGLLQILEQPIPVFGILHIIEHAHVLPPGHSRR